MNKETREAYEFMFATTMEIEKGLDILLNQKKTIEDLENGMKAIYDFKKEYKGDKKALNNVLLKSEEMYRVQKKYEKFMGYED